MEKSQGKSEVNKSNIYSVIGDNIKAIQAKKKMKNVAFYDLCFPGETISNATKNNKMAKMRNGKGLDLQKIISIAANTGTPISALFSETEKAYHENQSITEKGAAQAMAALTDFFRIAGTNNPNEKGFILSKDDLNRYYKDFPAADGPEGIATETFIPPEPLYLRILPWYYAHGARVMLPVQGDTLFHFLTILAKTISPGSAFNPEERKELIELQLDKLANDPLNVDYAMEIGTDYDKLDECSPGYLWNRK